MWVNHRAKLQRLLSVAPPAVNGHRWRTTPGHWGSRPALVSSPAEFVFAAMRTTCTTIAPGWRGVSAAAFGALSAISYLEANARHGLPGLQLHPDLDDAKDFSRNMTKGLLGAAFAYLDLCDNGFTWFGHWEDACDTPSTRSPDFIFGGPGRLAVVEAKGTAQGTELAIRAIKAAWQGQLASAARLVGADEGWVVATRFDPSKPAELIRAHAAFSSSAALAVPGPARGGPTRAVLANLADWINDRQLAAVARRPTESLYVGVPPNNDYPDSDVVRGRPMVFAGDGNGQLILEPLCRTSVLSDLQRRVRLGDASLPETIYTTEIEVSGAEVIMWRSDGSGLAFRGARDLVRTLFAEFLN